VTGGEREGEGEGEGQHAAGALWCRIVPGGVVRVVSSVSCRRRRRGRGCRLWPQPVAHGPSPVARSPWSGDGGTLHAVSEADSTRAGSGWWTKAAWARRAVRPYAGQLGAIRGDGSPTAGVVRGGPRPVRGQAAEHARRGWRGHWRWHWHWRWHCERVPGECDARARRLQQFPCRGAAVGRRATGGHLHICCTV
jgi:hypothetical protein